MKKWALIGVMAMVALLAGGYAFSSYKEATQGIAPTREDRPQGRPDGGRMSPFGREGPMGGGRLFDEKERAQMAKDIGLSDEQQKKIDAVFAKAREGGWDERRKAMEEARALLTPEQQKKAEGVMRSRMEERMKKRMEEARSKMTPAEFEAFKRRMDTVRGKMERGESPFPAGATPRRRGDGRQRDGGSPAPEATPAAAQP